MQASAEAIYLVVALLQQIPGVEEAPQCCPCNGEESIIFDTGPWQKFGDRTSRNESGPDIANKGDDEEDSKAECDQLGGEQHLDRTLGALRLAGKGCGTNAGRRPGLWTLGSQFTVETTTQEK
jgi:hypothetical protein